VRDAREDGDAKHGKRSECGADDVNSDHVASFFACDAVHPIVLGLQLSSSALMMSADSAVHVIFRRPH
jgi:hypothetical protein